MIVFHDSRCVEYVRAAIPNAPVESLGGWALLRDRHPDWAWQRPATVTYEALKRAHSSAHIHAVEETFADFNTDTPAYPKIYKHPARATGAAVEMPAKRCGKSSKLKIDILCIRESTENRLATAASGDLRF
jgi:hypothetical protein